MSSSLAKAKSTNIKLVKPFQPTQLWTFANAYSLLKENSDSLLADALDEFLTLNKNLILDPTPLAIKAKALSENAGEFTLRGILYSKISLSNIKDAEKLSKLLRVDPLEALRMIHQSCLRAPEADEQYYRNLGSKIFDNKDRDFEAQRLLNYSGIILREKRMILKLVIELINNNSNSTKSKLVRDLGKEVLMSDSYLIGLLNCLENSVDELFTKGYVTHSSESIDSLICSELILYITDQMKILVEILAVRKKHKYQIVISWFKIMEKYNFISSLGSRIENMQSLFFLQALATIVSLLFLNLEGPYGLDESKTIYSDSEVFLTLHQCITRSNNSNSIVIRAWMIVLLRVSVLIEEHSDHPVSKKILESTNLYEINEQMSDLSVRSTNVFEDIRKLNDMLKFDNIYSAILTTLILSAMPLVTVTPDIATTVSSVTSIAPNSIIQKFYNEDSTSNAIILARAKFPLSLIPYLRFCSINGYFAYHEFKNLRSYMYLLDKYEFEGKYVIDDQDTELVKLKEGIDLYPPFEHMKKASFYMKEGTKGKIIPGTNNDAIMVTFFHNYNGWAFLGRVLQNVSRMFDSNDPEKVNLISSVLSVMNKVITDCSVDEAMIVLKEMSAFTDNSDVVEVIFGLLEQGLHSRNITILNSILEFLTHSTALIAGRIWQYLDKSFLFTKDGKEGQAATVFGSIEMVIGEYSFTINLIKFIDALAQNCMSLDDTYTLRNKSIILEKMIVHLRMIFEGFAHCKFNHFYQRMEIGVLILDIFSNILATVYGSKTNENPNKVVAVYIPASKQIIKSFLVDGNDVSRTLSPIISMLDVFESYIISSEINDISGFWFDNWIRCSLGFSQLLLFIRSEESMPPSAFERLLFTKLPELVNAYAKFVYLRKDILDLMTLLTSAKWPNNSCPSLLSHLGKDHAQVLLSSLTYDLENKFDNYHIKISLYDFICAVMESNQEGLAVTFINGRDVFMDFSKCKKAYDCTSHSLFSVLKNNVKDIKYLPSAVSLHLVDALSLVINSWSTARNDENDNDFVSELIAQINYQGKELPENGEQYLLRCYEYKLLAKTLEILSLVLFSTENELIRNKILEVITSHEFIQLAESHFHIREAQNYLHERLEQNFEKHYPDFNLDQFRSALIKRNRFGYGNIYNISLLKSLFGTSEHWEDLNEQIEICSINFQFVQVQAEVAKSFGALFTALCRKFPSSLTSNFMKFVVSLLDAASREISNFNPLSDICLERVELSFFLTYTLYGSKTIPKADSDIIGAIRSCSELLNDSNRGLLCESDNNSFYYRPILRTLYCNLHLISTNTAKIAENISIFSSLFELVVAKFLKKLIFRIQNEVYLSKVQHRDLNNVMSETLEDLKLILSLLKIFCKLETPSKLYNRMEKVVEENNTITTIFNLYSFSHLVKVNDEYIFAQISLMFVQEFMCIEVLCESIISSGLFVVLSQSKISEVISKERFRGSSVTEYQRIWLNGILPIFLIALSKLGLSAVLDVCVSLRSFAVQIESCVESWSQNSSTIKINSVMVAETAQILLLLNILKKLNIDGSLKDILPSKRSNFSEDEIDMAILPGLETESKRAHLMNCIDNLLKHPKFLTSRVVPSSPEEELIFEKGDQSYVNYVSDLISDIRGLKEYII